MAGSRVEIRMLVGILVLGIGFTVHTVAIATSAWLVADTSMSMVKRDAEIGLFDICIGTGSCLKLKEMPTLQSVQALCIIALLISAIGGLLAIGFLFCAFLGRGKSKILPMTSFGCCLLAALCILIGIIVWSADFNTSENLGDLFLYTDLGYSFGLCIAGGCLIFLGGCLILMGGLRSVRFQNQTEARGPFPQMPFFPGGVSYVHQPGVVNYGQQPAGVVYGQQQGGVNYGQQPGGVNYGHHQGEVVHGQQPGGFQGQHSMGANYGQNPNGFQYGHEKGEINYGQQKVGNNVDGAATSSVS